MSRFIKITSVCAFSAMALFVCMTTYFLYQFIHQPLKVSENGYELVVSQGMTIGQIASELTRYEVMTNSRCFRWLAIIKGDDRRLQAGDYLIKPGTTGPQLLQKLVDGDVRYYEFTIIEGWRFSNLMQALEAHPKIKLTLTDHSPETVMKLIQRPATHPEGMFLAETFYFTAGTTDITLLQRAYDAMQAQLHKAWQQYQGDLFFNSPYEVLILASIIEKESQVIDEFEQISGVYHRRLQKRMRLQADPTVIYALNEAFKGRLYRKQLKIDSPYNTYRYHGLPPTPIAIPSYKAIHAALSPQEGEHLYFVADGEGGHRFSVTLEEHNKAVAQFRKRRAEQRLN